MSPDVLASGLAVAAVGLFTLAVGGKAPGHRRELRFHATRTRGWTTRWAPAIDWVRAVLVAFCLLLAGWSGCVVLFASGR